MDHRAWSMGRLGGAAASHRELRVCHNVRPRQQSCNEAAHISSPQEHCVGTSAQGNSILPAWPCLSLGSKLVSSLEQGRAGHGCPHSEGWRGNSRQQRSDFMLRQLLQSFSLPGARLKPSPRLSSARTAYVYMDNLRPTTRPPRLMRSNALITLATALPPKHPLGVRMSGQAWTDAASNRSARRPA